MILFPSSLSLYSTTVVIPFESVVSVRVGASVRVGCSKLLLSSLLPVRLEREELALTLDVVSPGLTVTIRELVGSLS